VVKLVPKCKVWLEANGRSVLGSGRALLLEGILDFGSLKKAAEFSGISYRTAQAYISRMERCLGEKIVVTERGGKSGGGGAALTDAGKKLLSEYGKAEKKHNAT